MTGAELRGLAEEQAALRRVATLVARGSPHEEVFAAVTEEVARLFPTDWTVMCRYVPDGAFAIVGSVGSLGKPWPVGGRWPLGGNNAATLVFETARPARIENYAGVSGAHIDRAREDGIRSTVGVPIIVEGRVWGLMAVVTTREEALPADTETRLADFTELVATAVANAQSRAELARLAGEQAALRRVATLVARGTPQEEVFRAVIDEVMELFPVDFAGMVRYEPDNRVTTVAARGVVGFAPGSTRILGGKNAATLVFETGRPVRIDGFVDASGALGDYARERGYSSAVATPIFVDGRLWGTIGAGSTGGQTVPEGTEVRLADFTELVATAIANAESRAGLARLADEQGSLRRVATLVAEGAPPTAVFDAVAAEMATLLGADGITLVRYEPEDEVTVLAHRGPGAQQVPPGTRVRHDGASVSATVRRTQRPARMESYADTHGHIGEVIEGLEYRSGVGAPIVVDGRLWGATIANWTAEEPPPPGTEDRLAEFAELLDTAIANADSSNQLAASRARLVTEADDARRRVVRDLHDGAQQRLLQTIVTLGLAQRALEPTNEKAWGLVEEALAHARQGNAELRELAHGILPGVLIQAGLRGGISSIVSRLDIPVEVDVPSERFPPEIEASAYFVAAEALTNVVKHSHAERAWVTARIEDRMLRIEVRDDGVGGADPDGHGLVGLRDRVTAISGQLVLETPEGGGTLLSANLPVSDG